MTDEKPKTFLTIKNSVILIASIIPILTLLMGAYKVVYWTSYFFYFNIDMKYVSTGISWTFSDFYVISWFWIYICLSSCYALRIYEIFRSKEKNYKYIIIEMIFFLLFFTYMASVVLGGPKVWVNYSIKELLILGGKKFPLLCIAFIIINSLLIFIFFYGDRIIKTLYSESSVDGKKHLNRKNIFVYGATTIVLFAISVIMINLRGFGDAKTKQDFWVTEDNKYVAMPISNERYALIEFEEKENVIVLYTDKRDFHEINDFPCTKKIFSKPTVPTALIENTDT